MKSVILSFLLFAAASAIQVKFKDCGSALAKDITVSVEPCEKDPCELKPNTNYTIKIAFVPDAASKNIKALVYGVVDGVPVPFPFDQPDACQNSGLKCPLTSGEQVTYTATLPVKSEYPAIKLLVKWVLEDVDLAKDLVCAEIAVAVVRGSKLVYNHEKSVDRHWYEV